MLDLVILSIFRQSEKYIHQYIKQIEGVFALKPGKYGAVWLEGDSTDNTYQILSDAKAKLEAQGHTINLIKYDCNGPYWASAASSARWLQLATCWNKCIDSLMPTKYSICVESDIKYNPIVVPKLIDKLDADHHVIYPMLMCDRSLEKFPFEIFYDTWGFSIANQKFSNWPPYFVKNAAFKDEPDLLELTTGGGMIVTTYDYQQHGRFDTNDCIMKYPAGTKLFMHKGLRIHHPPPADWGLK